MIIKMKNSGIVINIQKFSLHDGPGIRTVIFLKGCPLRCRWCANPESQALAPQILRDMDKCVQCGRCSPNKPSLAVSDCPVRALTTEGELMDSGTVVEKIMQDEVFYIQSGGGATISGGEPLVQIDFVESICKGLHDKNVSVAVETTGYSEREVFLRLLNAVDIILFDVKHYSSQKHMEYTGVENEKILDNLRLAVESGKSVTARIPIIPQFNHSLEDMEQFGELLRKTGVKKANLLPFHQFGENKYRLLNMEYQFAGVKALDKENLAPHKSVLESYGLEVKIGG